MEICESKASGIYRILNIVTGDYYLGSTVNFKRRSGNHLSELRRGINGNKNLQKSWDAYGEDMHFFEIIEKTDLESLRNVEQKYLDSLKPVFNSSNLALGGRSSIVKPEEVLSIFQMYATGLFRHREIAGLFGVSISNIGSILNRLSFKYVNIPEELLTACSNIGNYRFSKNPNRPSRVKLADGEKYGNKLSVEQVHQIRYLHSKGVGVGYFAKLFPVVNDETLRNVAELKTYRWVKYSGKSYPELLNLFIDKRVTYRKAVVQLSLDGEYITTYFSPSEAAQSLGFESKKKTGIINAANPNCRTKRAYGYEWVYESNYLKNKQINV